MKVTFIIKKAAKRYDTESMATIYVRFRNGRQLDSVAPTQLAINPNLWDDKDECVKTKAVCNEEMRTLINEEIRQLKTYFEKVYQQEKEAIDKGCLFRNSSNSSPMVGLITTSSGKKYFSDTDRMQGERPVPNDQTKCGQ